MLFCLLCLMLCHAVLYFVCCSVWYELAYIESVYGVQAGQRAWLLAFGSGFKFNSAVLVANRSNRTSHPAWEGFDAKVSCGRAGTGSVCRAARILFVCVCQRLQIGSCDPVQMQHEPDLLVDLDTSNDRCQARPGCADSGLAVCPVYVLHLQAMWCELDKLEAESAAARAAKAATTATAAGGKGAQGGTAHSNNATVKVVAKAGVAPPPGAAVAAAIASKKAL